MASDEYTMLVHLQARLLAQQIFTRSVLTAAFMNTPDPLASWEELRSEEMRGFDQAVRPKGAYEDEVWAKALEAFHYELNQIAERIRKQSSGVGGNGLGNGSRAAPGADSDAPTSRALQHA